MEQFVLVTEVHNFGGFFGGDTVTLSCVTWQNGSNEQTLTIDDAALINVDERHNICEGMLLALTMTGERVDRAELIAAAGYAELRQALGPPDLGSHLPGPLLLSHRCTSCGMWVRTRYESGTAICPLCHTAVPNGDTL
jgi:hypothetical protein